MQVRAHCRWIQAPTLTRCLTPDVLDKIVVHSYAALIRELLCIDIRLSYSMSSLTRYMSKATPVRLAYAKTMLRYLICVKDKQLTWCGNLVSLPLVFGEILGFVDSSCVDDKRNRQSSMAYYLFLSNAAFSCRATFLNNSTFTWRANHCVALRPAEAVLMALDSCCCEIVWVCKLAIEVGFQQLKPTDVDENVIGIGCIALANNMHLRRRSTHIALRVCFIQKLIQDGILNVKQCPAEVQTADIKTKAQALPRVPCENFTDQLLGDQHVGDKRFLIRPFLSYVCRPSSFHLVYFGRLLYLHEQIELQAKLLNYFLGSNKSNINQSCPCLALRLYTCSLSVLMTYEQGEVMRIAVASWLSVDNLLSTHAFRSCI